MRITSFSKQQKIVLRWWHHKTLRGKDAIICDGAVRSGKSMCMTLSFFLWAMCSFHNQSFALCGKTITSLRRNLWGPMKTTLSQFGFHYTETHSKNLVSIRFGKHVNSFYFFGGKDEGSAALIQGITLAGALLDEVALMPRSFVEQTCARCSPTGAKLWFNCNPEGPEHWFYKEWILKAQQRNALYLHFAMEDNPALSKHTLQQFKSRFSGTFFRRFILGEWVAAEGRVYDFFDESYICDVPDDMTAWRISCDYGTVNPASFGLWGLNDGVWYRIDEFYYDSKKQGRLKTDGEYALDLKRLAGSRTIEYVVVDPSAASFIECLRRDGWTIRKANNDVLSGIRITAELLKNKKIRICNTCQDALREFQMYAWDKKIGNDKVIKQFDHAMDDIRYFAASLALHTQMPTCEAAFVERARF